MTVITQTNFNAMQTRLERVLDDQASLIWHAGQAADEYCGNELALAADYRELEGLVEQSRGIMKRAKALATRMPYPGPDMPNFGNK